jgi:hypothetical protein
MTLRAAFLTFRIHRFETTLVVGATLLSVLVSAIVTSWIRTAGYDRCLTEDVVSSTALCQVSIAGWLFRIVNLSRNLVPIFPIVAGLLVGGPIVARELESGTARLAWSLGPSRLRWFMQRALPTILLAAIVGLVIGLTADALLRASEPSLDIDRSFVGFRQRGLLIGIETLVVASIALAIGSILGRIVPTFILSLILASGVWLVVDKVETQLLTNEAQTTTSFNWNGTDYFLTSRIQLPDGRIVTYEELFALHPELMDQGYSSEQYPDVAFYIPGSRYHDIELRDAFALTGVAVLFLALAGGTVVRRRPR